MESITGYVEPIFVSPGNKIAIKVSCSKPSYSTSLFRLGPGYSKVDGPPVQHVAITSVQEAQLPGRTQYSVLGSYARVNEWGSDTICSTDTVKVSFFCMPTMVKGAGHNQYLFSTIDYSKLEGFAAVIDEAGKLSVTVGGSSSLQSVVSTVELQSSIWHNITFEFFPDSCSVHVEVSTYPTDLSVSKTSQLFSHTFPERLALQSDVSLLLAGGYQSTRATAQPKKSASYNGKFASFAVSVTQTDSTTRQILEYDFSKDMKTDFVSNGVSDRYKCVLINAPTRAVRSYNWKPDNPDWTIAPFGYDAVHFHDDDLDDAEWETDFEVDLPDDLLPGPHAIRVADGVEYDYLVFFVRPKYEEKRPRVALNLSTFTYTCYANERMYDRDRPGHIEIPNSDKLNKGHHYRINQERTDLGLSVYDTHRDGSGVVYSSLKRPVINLRPNYQHWGFRGPRELSADLWMIGFLEKELGTGNYDVIYDHDIHTYQADLTLKYDVIISSCHPEYPSSNILDAYETFLQRGGSFMYLGGNGYYWVTAHDSARPQRIEVRRNNQGCRSYELPPGEWFTSLTGEFGGLWRGRGRPPNKLFGVGAAGCGMANGTGYGLSDQAKTDPKLAFVFRGIKSEDIIGAFDAIHGAAAGDEIDRLDYSLGSPKSAVILASSSLAGWHSDDYGVFPEETEFPILAAMGKACAKIRSDMVYFETAAGGAVFSVGSIDYITALANWNYENDIACVTSNVLHEFLRRSAARN